MACSIVALAACALSAVAQPPVIDVVIDLPGLSLPRITRINRTVTDGAHLLAEWFPPAPRILRVSEAQVRPRWLELARGASLEHAILREFAGQIWIGEGAPDAFRTALAEYSAAMAIHQTLPGGHVHVERFFNGAIPYPVRQVSLTPRGSEVRPRLRYFGPADTLDPAVDAWLRFLATLERYLGWPALQQALAALRSGGDITPPRLHALLTEQTGRELEWLFSTFDRKVRVDYAVVAFSSAASASGRFETTVRVERRGDGPAHSLPVLVRFADGSEIRDRVDGRDQETVLRYDSVAPARLASVDPDAFLMLDADRTNNTRTIEAPADDIGLRLAFNWMSWLQDAMLACTALI